MKYSKLNNVTLRQVAKHADVSLATASLVVRNSSHVSVATREKVQASIQELGYVYNRGAANVRAKDPSIIGLILSDLVNPYYNEVLIGIQQELNKLGIALILGTTFDSPSMQDNLISIMLEHRVGGILVFLSPDSSIKSITQIKRLGIPLVLINRRLDKALCDFIGIDNVKGGQMVTEYLIKKGHRRIAFLGGLSNLPVWQDRKNGYEKALRLSGLEIDNSLIMESLPVRESGSELMKKILLHPNPPTAAFCFNDTIAVGAMMALKEKGLAPGYDMAIVGFDDTLEGQAFIPKLTTVYAFPRVIGVKALNLLKARIDGLDSEIQNIILEPELIVRESCSYKTDL